MENLTPKQTFVYQILTQNKDANGALTVHISNDLQYPPGPDSINPALVDLTALKNASRIGDFERIESRTIKITGIQ